MKKIISHFKENELFHSAFKHGGKYFSSTLFNAIISMLMLKYYTKVFAPDDFGILSLYIMLSTYLVSLIGFTLDKSYKRIYLEYSEDNKKELLGTILISLTTLSLFWLSISFLFKNIIIRIFGGNSSYYYFSIAIAIFTIFANFFETILYSNQLSRTILIQNMKKTISDHGLSFTLIKFFNFGIISRLFGTFFGVFIKTLNAAIKLKKYNLIKIKSKFNIKILKEVLHFALPGFTTILLSTSFSYLDRIFLNHFYGKSEVGIYSLAFKIGMLMNMGVEAVSNSTFPTLIRNLNSDYKQNIKKVIKFDFVFIGFLFIIGLISYLLRDLIIVIISNEKYSEAGNVFPFLIFMYVVGGSYKTASSVLSYHKKVWFFPFISVLSFGIGAILNYIFIPVYHEVGAAYASFLAALIYAFTIQIIASKFLHNKKSVFLIYIFIFIMITFLFILNVTT